MRNILFVFLFSPLFLRADKPLFEGPQVPWFTGPLITTAAVITKGGHINIQPDFFVLSNFGFFDNNWGRHRFKDSMNFLNWQFLTWVGLNNFMDLFLNPQFYYNYTGNSDSWQVGDPTIGFDFQLLDRELKDPWPAIKLSIYETFPLGKYQKLKLEKLATDAGGSGTYTTFIGLTVGYTWVLKFPHFFAGRAALVYDFSTKLNVRGLNAYGGDPTTLGVVYPGSDITLFLGGEYSLTRNWALAADAVSLYSFPTRFRGRTIVPVGNVVGNQNSSFQFSIAPAIEYNFSENFGMIGGVWFSLFGKNAYNFISGVFSVNWVS